MIARQGTAFITVFDGENFNVITDSSGHIMTRSQWNELKKVMDSFYEQHSDLDIKRHNKDAVERRMEETRNQSTYNPTKKRQRPGTVYFIGYEGKGVKIGYTRNLRGRLKQLQVASPHKIYLLGKIECDDPEDVEYMLHQCFKDKLLVSEWYDLSEDEIENCIRTYQLLTEGQR